MPDTFQFLSGFHPITTEAWQLLSDSFRPASFQKNDYIVKPGQVQRNLYFVKAGTQVSYFETERKQHVVAFTYPPGLCAIPDSFQQQKPSQCFLQCLTDSEFESVSFDALQGIFNKSQEVERVFRKMTEAVLAGVIQRHMELHSLSIEERFRVFAKRSPHLLQLVQHKWIASYLNIDSTNFSKLYNSIKI